MELNDIDRTLTSSGSSEEYVFGIDEEDQTHLMMVLRDTLYRNAKQAFLREYSSNGWDANRFAKRGDVPLDIKLPTSMSPTLVIRDCGPGLSEEEVAKVYTRYGKSTKRGNNLQTGTLGLGCKSAFAYSDSFSITSWNGGMKKNYVAVLDESNKGKIVKMLEEPCPIEETGIEISVPVRPQDIGEFHNLARPLFRYMVPSPNINLTLDIPPRREECEFGFLSSDYSREWVAIMGCIPYRLDPSQLRNELVKEQLWDMACYSGGGLYFDIGEIHFSASREELKYDEETRAAVVSRFRQLVDKLLAEALETMTSEGSSSWEKRTLYRTTTNKLRSGNVFGPSFNKWSLDRITFKQDFCPKTFRFSGKNNANIQVHENARVILKDDNRTISGYAIGPYDRVVIPLGKNKPDDVTAELETVGKEYGFDGIPIVLASTLDWSSNRPGFQGSYADQSKFAKNVFLYKKNNRRDRNSDDWEIIDHTPCAEDVFVIISGFQAVDLELFPQERLDDVSLHKELKLDEPLPDVLGYKTTKYKPLTPADCPGTYYPEWRKSYWKQFITPERENLLMQRAWADVFVASASISSMKATADHLKERLGENHRLTKLFRRVQEVSRYGCPYWVDQFNSMFPEYQKKALGEVGEIYSRYPLLGVSNNTLNCLRSESFGHWVDYIIMKDLCDNE